MFKKMVRQFVSNLETLVVSLLVVGNLIWCIVEGYQNGARYHGPTVGIVVAFVVLGFLAATMYSVFTGLPYAILKSLVVKDYYMKSPKQTAIIYAAGVTFWLAQGPTDMSLFWEVQGSLILGGVVLGAWEALTNRSFFKNLRYSIFFHQGGFGF